MVVKMWIELGGRKALGVAIACPTNTVWPIPKNSETPVAGGVGSRSGEIHHVTDRRWRLLLN
jgi:hypothetical protein